MLYKNKKSKKRKATSTSSFRSRDLKVMSLARYTAAPRCCDYKASVVSIRVDLTCAWLKATDTLAIKLIKEAHEPCRTVYDYPNKSNRFLTAGPVHFKYDTWADKNNFADDDPVNSVIIRTQWAPELLLRLIVVSVDCNLLTTNSIVAMLSLKVWLITG